MAGAFSPLHKNCLETTTPGGSRRDAPSTLARIVKFETARESKLRFQALINDIEPSQVYGSRFGCWRPKGALKGEAKATCLVRFSKTNILEAVWLHVLRRLQSDGYAMLRLN